MKDVEYHESFFNSLFNKPYSDIIEFVKKFVNPHHESGFLLSSDKVIVEKKSLNDVPYSITIKYKGIYAFFSIKYNGIEFVKFGTHEERNLIFEFSIDNIRNMNINELLQ